MASQGHTQSSEQTQWQQSIRRATVCALSSDQTEGTTPLRPLKLYGGRAASFDEICHLESTRPRNHVPAWARGSGMGRLTTSLGHGCGRELGEACVKMRPSAMPYFVARRIRYSPRGQYFPPNAHGVERNDAAPLWKDLNSLRSDCIRVHADRQVHVVWNRRCRRNLKQ